MKKDTRRLVFTTALALVFLSVPSLVHAQGDPGCDPLDPLCPIDGGLGFLLAAGAVYGLKKIRKSRKKESSAI